MDTWTFKTADVEKFLVDSGNNFASLCWHNYITTDYVDSITVANWFKRHFPSNVNQFLFRSLEANVTQYITTS